VVQQVHIFLFFDTFIKNQIFKPLILCDYIFIKITGVKNAVSATPPIPLATHPAIHGLRVVQLLFFSGTGICCFSPSYLLINLHFGIGGIAVV